MVFGEDLVDDGMCDAKNGTGLAFRLVFRLTFRLAIRLALHLAF